MGTAGMIKPAPFHDPRDPYQYYNYDYHIPAGIEHTLASGNTPIADWLKPIQGTELKFTTNHTASGAPVTMIPYYDMHHERYVVYWNLK
jgi:uncharacterized protein